MKQPYLFIALVCLGHIGAAHADCFADAANYQHVNPQILRAIAWQESHFHTDAVHRNANGSIDYGMMQINSIHLRRLSHYGISQDQLMDPCASVYIAAWHLREKMLKYGNTWEAIGSYHSETPEERDDYGRRIRAIVAGASQVGNERQEEHDSPAATPPVSSNDPTDDRTNVVLEAATLIGTPYRWGGNSPFGGFDCSGLVQYVMKHAASIELPRTTAQISREGVPLTRKDLAPGDLVFFKTLGRAHSHVGIYVGKERFISAPSTGGTVRIEQLGSAYWAPRLDGIRRVMSTQKMARSEADVGAPVAGVWSGDQPIQSVRARWPSLPAQGGKDSIAEAIARSDAWMATHSAN